MLCGTTFWRFISLVGTSPSEEVYAMLNFACSLLTVLEVGC